MRSIHVNGAVLSTLVILNFYAVHVESLRFLLPNGDKKCVKEEIHKNVLVTGEYELSPAAPGQTTHLTVKDTRSHTLYNKAKADRGKFAFTTDEYDIFEVCFESAVQAGQRASQREVFLTMKHGVEAKSYDELAKAEKMKPLEVELKRLEDLSESIVRDFAYMRAREEEMRNTNESTHSRVLYLSIFSMTCLFGLAAWQVLYLRRYFKSKKLID